MLTDSGKTVSTELRDYPDWHLGRTEYAVWLLGVEDNSMLNRAFERGREHLKRFLWHPYPRQAHLTLFAGGVLVGTKRYEDDYTELQVAKHRKLLKQAKVAPFEITLTGMNSFESAPFLAIEDPGLGISRLRQAVGSDANGYRTYPYRPHLTLGLYNAAYAGSKILNHMADYQADPVSLRVNQISLATYRSNSQVGKLTVKESIALRSCH